MVGVLLCGDIMNVCVHLTVLNWRRTQSFHEGLRSNVQESATLNVCLHPNKKERKTHITHRTHSLSTKNRIRALLRILTATPRDLRTYPINHQQTQTNTRPNKRNITTKLTISALLMRILILLAVRLVIPRVSGCLWSCKDIPGNFCFNLRSSAGDRFCAVFEGPGLNRLLPILQERSSLPLTLPSEVYYEFEVR